MSPADILHACASEGVRLALSPAATLKASGEQAKVERWLPVIREHKAEIVAALQASTSHRWLIHFAGHEPLEVVCAPAETQATMLARYPAALKAEPYTPQLQLASSPLSGTDEAAVRAWLAHIGEIDPACISEVLGLCRQDATALDYFLGRAREAVQLATDDDRRTCAQCDQLNSRGQCLAARCGEIDAARNYSPVRDILRRCHAFVPKGEGYDSWPTATV